MSATGSVGSSELRLRVLSSLVLGAAALLSAWVGGWLLALVWLGAAIAVTHEWMTIARVAPSGPVAAAAMFGIAAIQFAWILASGPVFAGVVLVALAAAAFLAQTPRDKGWAVLGLLYAAPIAIVPVMFRFHHIAGIWSLLWMFAVVWSTDVVAYFVGRAVGGPKLWPAVSPKKTWSGFVGGLVGAVTAGVAIVSLHPTARLEFLDGVAIAALSALASVASQAGDLAESAMKRHFGVKDSGSLIPGHGGFMDRLDGFAAVAILICLLIPLAQLVLGPVGPGLSP